MEDFDRQLMVAAPVSLGLLAIGIVQILLPRIAPAWRVGFAGAAMAAALLLAANLTADDRFAAGAAATGTAGAVLAIVAQRTRIELGRPRRVGAAIAAAGAVLLGVTVVRHEIGLNDKLDSDTEEMSLHTYMPEREPDPATVAYTDRGRAMTIWRPVARRDEESLREQEARSLRLARASAAVERIGDASETTNCHGWVFTGGRTNLTNAEVEMILADNGYERFADPKPGDLAIYRNGVGITHTAIVRAVEPGRPVVVESKWSWMGVFRHDVGDSIYGVDFAYYRSPRADHLVKLTDRSTPIFSGAE